ncbi:MAG: MFS transporter [Pseudomonadota bacterium]
MANTESNAQPSRPQHNQVGGRYSWYVLSVLMLVYVFNFIDRQILSILNEDIKADLGVTDAQMGFLYGTAFAVFYAVFGIPLGRLADIWTRKSMIALGLFFWSLMTVLSGTAKGFVSLAAYRIGVGIGESSASPAAYSMLGDYFPTRMRATAVAIYSSGIYLGVGIGMLIGGQIVDRWNALYPLGTDPPWGLVGWQVAFIAVGTPGLLMALWVATLKEPSRGQSEGLAPPKPHAAPFREFARELMAVLPPFTLFSLYTNGGPRAALNNLLLASTIALVAWGLAVAIGSPVQWIALGVGCYAFFSWVQGLGIRDQVAFKTIYQCPTLIFGMVGFAWCAFVGYGGAYWGPPYFIRVHGESASSVGTIIGITAMTAGWLGVTLGGIFSDWLKARTPLGRTHCGIITAVLSAPFGFIVFTTPDLQTAYVANFFFTLFSSLWIGPAIAFTNELVVPRLRATASATYILVVTMIGLALGPFTIGQISTTLSTGGMESGEALRIAGLCGGIGYLFAIIFMLFAARGVEATEASRVDRARRAGEII